MNSAAYFFQELIFPLLFDPQFSIHGGFRQPAKEEFSGFRRARFFPIISPITRKEGTMKKALVLGLVAATMFGGCSKPSTTGTEGTKTAAAGPFEASYTAFQSAFEAKDYGRALVGLRSLMATFWAESSLVLGNVKHVKGANNSYGIYEPKESDVFSAGEPIYLYMEPAGYALTKNPGGYYEFGFSADFQIADAGGKILGGQTNFASMPFKSWNFNTEIALTFTYTVSGLEKGKYKTITQVTDTHSGKKATVEKEFTVE
jgi:hypothetical protein